METVYRDYHPKDVQFFYVYKTVEHPEINNFVSAFTLDERLLHVAEAKKRLKTEIPFICDTMENGMKKSLGPAPNGEYIIDPEGKLVRKRFWSDPKTLRKDLESLVGPVDKVTKVEDLDVAFTVEERKIASGVVPRLELPRGLTPLQIAPKRDSKHPYFAKLRVEVTRSYFRPNKEGDRKGQLHLSVNLDPLYKVHWNNRAGKVSIELEAPDGLKLSKTTLESADVKEDADIDPRQFLIDLETPSDEGVPVQQIQGMLKAVVKYTVCDDAETFCIPITQEYLIPFRPTRNLGSRPDIFMPAYFGDLKRLDKNGDGNLTKDELPPGEVTMYIGHIDYNGNEVIEAEEIERFLKMFNNGKGFRSDKNDGQK